MVFYNNSILNIKYNIPMFNNINHYNIILIINIIGVLVDT